MARPGWEARRRQQVRLVAHGVLTILGAILAIATAAAWYLALWSVSPTPR